MGDVANSQRVVLVAGSVGRPRHEAMIEADLERADVEEVVSLRFDVLVEDQLVGRRVGRTPAAVDRIALALDRTGRVEPAVLRDRRRDVGLLDA